MKKVRFLLDLYDLEDKKFYSYNEVCEFSDKKAKDWADKGYVDILKEKPKKKPKKKPVKKDDKPQPKKEEKKDTKK